MGNPDRSRRRIQVSPGQYATLGVVSAEKQHERPYSIVSAPHEKFLEFFIELVPQGQVTPQLHKSRVGDLLTLRKAAKGSLTLDLSGGTPTIFCSRRSPELPLCQLRPAPVQRMEEGPRTGRTDYI